MDENNYAVDIEACRGRQRRLLAEMDREALDWVVLTTHESVQWLTGTHVGPLFAPAAALSASGHVTLVLPSRMTEQTVAADNVAPYEEKWHSTLRDQQRALSNEAIIGALPPDVQHVGLELSHAGPQLIGLGNRNMNIEELMFRLRRRKDADEVRMLRRAIDANRAMYARAREIIEPGVNELDVYNELHSTAVRTLGEPLTYFGQGFRSNARGGLPRDRAVQAGELYILDLGVGFRGYFSDNARTIAVDGQPTDAQQLAWERVSEIFPMVESRIRPEASCRQLFEDAQAMLDRSAPWIFNHHLGHGVGLRPQEGPHLNPRWDDMFEAGDFIAVEPGLYHDELCHGIRLEQNYIVTTDGVERLTDFPLELVC